jgi:hypothetical protein
MKRAAAILAVLCGPAGGQALGQTPPSQWEDSTKSIYDLVQDGFELKVVRDEFSLGVAAPLGFPAVIYYLQKSRTLARCVENLPILAGMLKEPGRAPRCQMLIKPK